MRLMEPLGIAPETVEIRTLTRWAEVPVQHRYTDYSNSLGEANHFTDCPFPSQNSINRKIALWYLFFLLYFFPINTCNSNDMFPIICTFIFNRTGDISVLQVDAVVNPTNETMNDNSPTCQKIFSRAGPALNIEIDNDIKGIIALIFILG